MVRESLHGASVAPLEKQTKQNKDRRAQTACLQQLLQYHAFDDKDACGELLKQMRIHYKQQCILLYQVHMYAP